MNFTIRNASINDKTLILDFIIELARYEKLEDQVKASIKDVEETFFIDNPKVFALILEDDKKQPAGFAVFFYNYSTFLCKHGIYIEDIYVKEEYRGRGFGKEFFKHICKIAKDKNCMRVEWWCLDWNKPSIDFYTKLGAEPMSEWTVYRLNNDKITAIANK